MRTRSNPMAEDRWSRMTSALSSREGHQLIGVALLSVIVRVMVRLTCQGQAVETFEHEHIAQALLDGKGFGLVSYGGAWYRTFGSPPFAYLCALVYRLTGHSHTAMLWVQWLFSAVTTAACAVIGRRLFSWRVGMAAAVLVALHPGFVFYETHKIHPLSLDAMLAALGILTVLVLKTNRSLTMAACGGVLHGLALFERSTQVALVPLAVVSLWQSRSGGGFVRRVVAYGMMILAVMGPWTIRNILLYHQPVFVTTTSAEVFWRGNNPLASGGAYAKGRPGVSVFDATPPAFQQRVVGKDELAQRHIFFREGMAYIRSHPVDALKLYITKLRIFWWFAPESGFLYASGDRIIYQWYYGAMLGLAALGLLAASQKAAARQRQEQVVLAVFLLSVALVQAVFYVEIRHRWGIEPLLLIWSAAGGVAIQEAIWHRMSLRPRLAAGSVGSGVEAPGR